MARYHVQCLHGIVLEYVGIVHYSYYIILHTVISMDSWHAEPKTGVLVKQGFGGMNGHIQ